MNDRPRRRPRLATDLDLVPFALLAAAALVAPRQNEHHWLVDFVAVWIR